MTPTQNKITPWEVLPTFLGFPIGWKRLGEIEGCNERYDPKSKRTIKDYKFHTFCNTNLWIGRYKDKLFYFCPKCLIETDRK